MQPNSSAFTFLDYFAAVKRRRSIFVAIFTLVIAAAVAYASVLPSEYRSVARISVDLKGVNIRTLEPIQVAAYADQYIAELMDRVLSRDNLARIAENPELFPAGDSELSLAEKIRVLRDGFYLILDAQPVTDNSGREVEIISGFLTGFAGPDPEVAQKAASLFSESFLREDRFSRTERASSTSAFLTQQIAETEKRIVANEREIAEFKVENACCLPELRELNMSVIQRAERDLEGLQLRMRTLEQDRIFLQAQLDEIRQRSSSAGRLEELEGEYLELVANYGADHPDVSRLRREINALTVAVPDTDESDELTQLRMELAAAEQKYSDIHPDVLRLQQRIASLEAQGSGGKQTEDRRLIEDSRYLQLRAEINAIDTELRELRRRGPELREKISVYEQRLALTPQVESEYKALNRKLETSHDNFENLQRQLVTARQTEALESAEIAARLSEIDSAYVPDEPSGPPRLAIIILGAFLAGGLGIGSVAVAEIFDSSVRDSTDLYRITDLVPLATIPVIQNSVTRTADRRNVLLAVSSFLLLVIGIAVIVMLRIM